jgi:hypothetical protein
MPGLQRPLRRAVQANPLGGPHRLGARPRMEPQAGTASSPGVAVSFVVTRRKSRGWVASS